jgi:hypothetical protein
MALADELRKYRVYVVLGGTLYLLVQQGLAMYLVFLVVALLALLWWHQGKLLYMPQPNPQLPRANRANPRMCRSPAEWNMPHEDVAIHTRDGVRVSAWFIQQPEAPETKPTGKLAQLRASPRLVPCGLMPMPAAATPPPSPP